MTRVVIAGSRFYDIYDEAVLFIDQCMTELTLPFVILSGGCRGADAIGETYAMERNIPLKRYLPEWRIYGRGAGPKRNRKMIDECDAVICFWDGKSRGTKSLIEYAKEKEKPIFIKYIQSPPPSV